MAIAAAVLIGFLILAAALLYAIQKVASQIVIPRPTQNVPRETIPQIEVTPEKFQEMKYRKRMTPAEASAHYEKLNNERAKKAAQELSAEESERNEYAS